MAKKKHLELFELMAVRQKQKVAAPEAGKSDGVLPAQRILTEQETAVRTGREIIFSVDLAFIIFVAFVLLLFTAFQLGHKNGRIEQAQALKLDDGDIARMDLDKVSPLNDLALTVTRELPRISGNEFTLKLRSTRDRSREELGRLRIDLAHVLANDLVRSGNHSAYIYDNDKVYSLGVGLFGQRDDETLKKLQEIFRNDAGPATSQTDHPYGGFIAAQTRNLGKIIE
jgi:hypothetical protein